MPRFPRTAHFSSRSTGSARRCSFAIDTTGSMGPVISVIQNCSQDCQRAPEFLPQQTWPVVLAPFNDPSAPPAMTFTDPGKFISAILSLTASGGGDCHELAMAGLQNANSATSSWGQ